MEHRGLRRPRPGDRHRNDDEKDGRHPSADHNVRSHDRAPPREIRTGRRGTDFSALSLRCRYFVVQTLNAGVTFVAAWLAFGLLHIQEEV